MADRTVRVRLTASVRDYESSVNRAAGATDKLRRKAEQFDGRRYTATGDVNTAQGSSKLNRLRGMLSGFSGRNYSANAGVDTARGAGKINRLRGQLTAFGGKRYTATATVNTSGGSGRARALAAAILTIGPAAVTAASVASAALAGLSSAMGAGIAAAGTAALGFSGLGDALGAMGDQATGASAASAGNAAAVRAQQQAVSDARRSIVRAERDQARAAQQGAQDIADAKRQLGRAYQNAADSVADAQRQVQDADRQVARASQAAAQQVASAQQRVEDARRQVARAAESAADRIAAANRRVGDAEDALSRSHDQVRYAQEDLTQAREDALDTLTDMRRRTTDLALSQESAEIRLIEAQRRLQEVESDSASSALDLRKARLGVAEAEDRLSDVQYDRTNHTEDLAEAERKGIEGADNVVAARRSVEDAERSVADAQDTVIRARENLVKAEEQANQRISDAQRSLAEARENLSQTEVQAQQRIADAQRTAADARRNLARTERQANQQIADATRNLQRTQQQASQANVDAAQAVADAQRQLQRALQQTTGAAGGAAGGVDKLAEAMANLSPAGRRFARFLFSLRPKLKELQAVAQAGMFPGMEAGIRSAMNLFPNVLNLVDQTAQAIGDLSAEAGAGLDSQFWRDYIDFLANDARPTIMGFGRALGSIIEGFAAMQMALDPLSDDFIRGFEGMAQSFEDWAKSLEGSNGLEEFITYARENGPLLLDLFDSVVELLGSIVEAAKPVGPVIIQGLTKLADALNAIMSVPGLGTGLVAIGAGLSAINLAGKVLPFGRIGKTAGAASKLAIAFHGIRLAKLLGVGTALGSLGGAASKSRTRMANMTATMGTVPIAMDRADRSSRRATKGMGGVRGVATKVGKTLPVVGAAVVGLGLAWDAMNTSSKEAATALEKGGQASAKVRAELTEQDRELAKIEESYGGVVAGAEEWFRVNVTGQANSRSAREELEAQRAEMSALERAQSIATEEQNDYNLAVSEYGPASAQARDALGELSRATQEVKTQQVAAKYGLSDTTAAIIAQGQTEQEQRASKEALTQAQESYNTAVQQHGAGSTQAKDAMLKLQVAQAKATDAARKGKNGTQAYTDTLREMVSASGGELTPVLRSMISELDATGLAAMGASVKIDGTGQAVATLPNGKTVKVNADTMAAMGQLGAVAANVRQIPANKPINVGVLSAPAQEKLRSIGFDVRTLPNGQVEVTAKSDQARAELIAFTRFGNAQETNPDINADPQLARDTLYRFIDEARQETGLPSLSANPAEADRIVNDAIGRYNGMQPEPTMFANTQPADQSGSNWFRAMIGLEPTPNIFADSHNADIVGSSWYDWANGLNPFANLSANDDDGVGVAQRFVNWVNGLRGTVDIIANAIGLSSGGIVSPMAQGGIVPMANGGRTDQPDEFAGHKLRTMPNTGARMVNPNTWRVVGDRMDVPELYAPLDGSSRSLGLIAQGANTFGYGLIDMDALYKGAQKSSKASASASSGGGLGEAFSQLTGALSTIEIPRPVNVQKVMAETSGAVERTVNNYLEVNNPIRERTSDSLQSELSRWADLGIFADD